jgi:hypothetical protein
MKPGPLRTLFRVVVVFSCVVALAVAALVGWRAYYLLSTAIPAPADADIPVPDEFTGQLTLPGKKAVSDPGPATVTLDGPTLYRSRFRTGWEYCLNDYRSGRLDPDITRDKVVTFGDGVLADSAYADGYMACAAEVRKRMGR